MKKHAYDRKPTSRGYFPWAIFENAINTYDLKSFISRFSASSAKGRDGHVVKSMIKSGTLDRNSKRSYPMQLLRIMKRKAEDLLLGDESNVQGKAALIFIKNVINEKQGVRANVLKKGIASEFYVFGC